MRTLASTENPLFSQASMSAAAAASSRSLGLQVLPILRQPHLKADDLEREVGLFEQRLPRRVVAGADERLQKAVERPLDPFAEDKALVAGKPAGVSAASEDQIVGLGDHGQLLIPGLATRHGRKATGVRGALERTAKKVARPGAAGERLQFSNSVC